MAVPGGMTCMHPERMSGRPGCHHKWTRPHNIAAFAEECRRLAEQVESDRHRRLLHEMALAWSKLADKTESAGLQPST
jgi:hypothetical protein